jgi:hypothetical protein
MPGMKGRSGGAREGSGPVRRRFTLSGPAAIYLKVLTQVRTGRKAVTVEECSETLEAILAEHARADDRTALAALGPQEGEGR